MNEPFLPELDDTTTVAELAAELRATFDDIRTVSKALRLRVHPDSRRVSVDDADQIRTYFAFIGGAAHLHESTEPRPEWRFEAATVEHDPTISHIEEALGVPWHKRHARSRRVRLRHVNEAVPKRVVAEPALTGTAAAAFRRWPQVEAPGARAIAAGWTGRHGFSEHQAEMWWQNGLGRHDAELASRLAANNIRPEHLPLMIRRETVLERIRDNMSLRRIADMLEREGYLAR